MHALRPFSDFAVSAGCAGGSSLGWGCPAAAVGAKVLGFGVDLADSVTLAMVAVGAEAGAVAGAVEGAGVAEMAAGAAAGALDETVEDAT